MKNIKFENIGDTRIGAKIFARFAKILFVALFFVFAYSTQAFAANLWYHSANTSCDGTFADIDCWDTTSALSVKAMVAPGASDTAYFVSASGTCNINATRTIAALNMTGGSLVSSSAITFSITGTLTMSAGSVDFSGSALALGVGSTTSISGTAILKMGGSAAFDGWFYFYSGTVWASSGTTSFNNNYSQSGGTFQYANGTVEMGTGTAHTFLLTGGSFEVTGTGAFNCNGHGEIKTAGIFRSTSGASGVLTFDNSLWLLTGGTLNTTLGNNQLIVYDLFSISGTFTAGSGTMMVGSGDSADKLSVYSGGSASFGTGTSFDINGNMEFLDSSTTVTLSTGTTYVSGDINIESGVTFSYGASGTRLLYLDGSSNTTVKINAKNLFNFRVNKTTGYSVTVSDYDLVVDGYCYVVYGELIMGSVSVPRNLTVGTNLNVYYGTLTNYAGTVYSQGQMNLGYSTGVINLGSGTVNVDGNVIFSNGAVTMTSGVFSAYTSFTVASSVTFSHNSGTLQMMGISAGSFGTSDKSLYNLTIEKSSGTLTQVSDSRVDNTYLHTSGTLNTGDYAIRGTANFTVNSGTLNNSGSQYISTSGTFTVNNGTVVFGSGKANATGNFNQTGGSVGLNGGSMGVSGYLSISAGNFVLYSNSDLTMSGAMTVSGTGDFNAGSYSGTFLGVGGNFTFSSSADFDAPTYIFEFAGTTFSVTSSAAYNANGGLIKFMRPGTSGYVTLDVNSAITFFDVEIALTGSGTYDSITIGTADVVNITGALTLNSGELNTSTGYLNVIGDSSGNGALYVKSTWPARSTNTIVQVSGTNTVTGSFDIGARVPRLIVNNPNASLVTTCAGLTASGSGTIYFNRQVDLQAGKISFERCIDGFDVEKSVYFTGAFYMTGGEFTIDDDDYAATTFAATFNMSGGTYTDDMGTTFSSFTLTGGTMNFGTGTRTFNTTTYIYGGNFNAGTGDYVVGGVLNVNNAGVTYDNTAVVTFASSNSLILNSAFSIGYGTTSTGSFTAPGAGKTFTLFSNFTSNGNTSFVHNSSTLVIQGGTSATSTTFSGNKAIELHNLTINKADGSNVVVNNSVNVNGDLTYSESSCSGGSTSTTLKALGSITYSANANGGSCFIELARPEVLAPRTFTVETGSVLPNIIINSSKNQMTGPASGTFTLQNSLYVYSGTFDGNASTVTINGNLTKTGGTFTPNGSTFKFAGAGNSTIDTNTSIDFTNLNIEKSSDTAYLAVASGDTVNVNGTLSLVTGQTAITTGAEISANNVLSWSATFNGAYNNTGYLGSLRIKTVSGNITLPTFTSAQGYVLPSIILDASNVSRTANLIFYLGTNSSIFVLGNVYLPDHTYDGYFYNTGNTNLIVGGDITVDGGAFLGLYGPNTVSSSFEVNGNVILNGGNFYGVNGTATTSKTAILNGNLDINGGNFWATTATSGTASSMILYGSVDQSSGVFYSRIASLEFYGTYIASGGTLNLLTASGVYFGPGSNLTVSGAAVSADTANAVSFEDADLSLSSGSFSAPSTTLSFLGYSDLIRGSGTFTHNNGTVVFGGSGDSVLDVSTISFYDLTVSKNSSLTVALKTPTPATVTVLDKVTVSSGTFDSSDADLTITSSIDNSLEISGGVFLAPSGTLTIAGGIDYSAGTYTHSNGLVVLNGTNQKITNDLAIDFYDFSKELVSATDTLIFDNATDVNVLNTATLKGVDSTNRLLLRSANSPSQWYFDPQGTRDFEFLDVKDGYNSNISTILLAGTGSYDSGNNYNWSFGPKYWVGPNNGSWDSSSNWSSVSGGVGGAGVPVPGDDVYFDNSSNNCVIPASFNITIGNLDIASTYTGTISGGDGDFIVSGDFVMDGGVFDVGSKSFDSDYFYLTGGDFIGGAADSYNEFFVTGGTYQAGATSSLGIASMNINSVNGDVNDASLDFSDVSTLTVSTTFLFGYTGSTGSFIPPALFQVPDLDFNGSTTFSHNSGVVEVFGFSSNLNSNGQSFYDLKINKWGSGSMYGLNSAYATDDLNVENDFILYSGELEIESGVNIYVGGDWYADSIDGLFAQNTSTVYFNGTTQTIYDSTSFPNFSKIVTASDTLTFESGETQIITGSMTLQGNSGSALLSLRATSAGVQAEIDPRGTRTIAYLDVKDNNNVNATVINAVGTGSIDSGNNTNWDFGDRYWVGPTNNYWNNASYWATSSGGTGGAGIPGPANNVYFDNASNCIIPNSYYVGINSINLESSYSGTVSGGDGTFETGKIKVAGGTLNISNWSEVNVLSVDSDSFSQSGGTFISTVNELMIYGGMIRSSGTFTHNNGSVNFYSSNSVSVNTGGATFYSFVIQKSSSATVTLTSSTLNVANQLYLYSGNLDASAVSISITSSNADALKISAGEFTAPTGTITIAGGISKIGGTFTHNNGTVLFSGYGDSIIDTDSSLTLNNFTINKASDTANVIIATGDIVTSNGALTLTKGRMAISNTAELVANGTMVWNSTFNGAYNNSSYLGYFRIRTSTGPGTLPTKYAGLDGFLPAMILDGSNPLRTNHMYFYLGANTSITIIGNLYLPNNTWDGYLYNNGDADLTINGDVTMDGGWILANLGSNAVSDQVTFNGDVVINGGTFWAVNGNPAIAKTVYFNSSIENNGGTLYFNSGASGTSPQVVISGTGFTQTAGSTYSNIASLEFNAPAIASAGTLSFASSPAVNFLVDSYLTISGATVTANTTSSLYFENADFTMNSGSFSAPATTMVLSGESDFTRVAGTFTHNNGTVEFTGTGDSAITPGTITFYNLKSSKDSGSSSVISAATVSVADGLTLSSGILNASAATLNITSTQADAYLQTGGTFVAPSGTMTVSGGFDISAGTFTHSSGTVLFSGAVDALIDATGTTFYNLTSSKDALNKVTLASGTYTIANKFSLTSGTFDAGTSVSVNMNISSTLSDAYSQSGGTFLAPDGTLSLYGGINKTGGTFTHNDGTVSFFGTTNVTLAPGGITFYNMSVSKYTSNSVTVSAGTLNAEGTLLVATGILNAGSAVLNVNNFNQTGGIFTAPASSMSIYGSMTKSAGTFTHNNGTVSFEGSTNTSLDPGVVVFNQLAINKNSANSLTLTSGTLVTEGILYVNSGTLDAGSATLDVNGYYQEDGTFVAPSGTMSVSGGLEKISGTFTHNNGTVVFDGTGDVSFDVDTIGFYNLTVSKYVSNTLEMTGGTLSVANKLLISSGTLDASGVYINITSTASDSFSQSGGTFVAPIATLTLYGGMYRTGGTFAHNNGTVEFTGTANVSLTPDVVTFYDLKITKDSANSVTVSSGTLVSEGKLNIVSGTFDAGSATLSLNNFEQNGGVFVAPSGTMTVDGSFERAAGTFTHNSGTVVFDNTGDVSLDAPGIVFYNLTSEKDISDSVTTSSGDLDVDNKFTISSGTFDAGASTFTINSTSSDSYTQSGGTFEAPSGTMTMYGGISKSGGTFTHNNGTVLFLGASAVSLSSPAIGFYNLTASKNSGVYFTLSSGTLVVENLLSLTSGIFSATNSTLDLKNFSQSGGTFSAPSGSMYVSGNFNKTSGTFTSYTGTVSFDGSANSTIDIDSSINLNNLSIEKSSDTAYLEVASGDLINVAGTLALISGQTAIANTAEISANNLMDWRSTFNGALENSSYKGYLRIKTTTDVTIPTKTAGLTALVPSLKLDSSNRGNNLYLYLGTNTSLTFYGYVDLVASTYNPVFYNNSDSNVIFNSAVTIDDGGFYALYGPSNTSNLAQFDSTLTLNAGEFYGMYGASTVAKSVVFTGAVSVTDAASLFYVTNGSDWTPPEAGFASTLTVANGVFYSNIAEIEFLGNVTLNSGTLSLEDASGITFGASSVLDVNSGYFNADGALSVEFLNTATDITIDGGSFTSTENIMTLSGSIVQTAGSFVHNNGTVSFISSEDSSVTAPTYTTFYNLTSSKDSGVKLTLASGPIYVANKLSVTSGILDTSAIALTISSTLSDSYYQTGGEFIAPSGTLSLNGGLEKISGTFTHNSGTVLFSGAANSSIDVDVPLSLNNLTVSKSNDIAYLSVATGDVVTSNGTLTLTRGRTAIANGAELVANNAISWSSAFNGAYPDDNYRGYLTLKTVSDVTIPTKNTGLTAYLPSIRFDDTNRVSYYQYLYTGTNTELIFWGDYYQDTSNRGWFYNNGDADLTFLGSVTMDDGQFFGLDGASTSSKTVLFAGDLVLNGGAMYGVNGAASTAKDIEINGNVDQNGGEFYATSASSGTAPMVTIAGNYTQDSGNFWSGIASVYVSGIYDLNFGTLGLQNSSGVSFTAGSSLIVDGGTVNASTASSVLFSDADLTINTGLFTAPASTLTFNNDSSLVKNGGTFTHNSGTVVFSGNTDVVLSGNVDFYNLTASKSELNTLTIPAGTVGTYNKLTVTSGTLDASDATLNIVSSLADSFSQSESTFIAPSGTMTLTGGGLVKSSGTFNSNGGTVIFDGANDVSLNSSAVSFNNLTSSKTLGNALILSSGDLEVADTLTVSLGTLNASLATSVSTTDFVQSGGTFVAPATTLTVSGDLSKSGGTFTHNSGSVVLDGASQSILNGASALSFNNLSKVLTSVGDSLTFNSQVSAPVVVENEAVLKGTGTSARLALRSATPSTQVYFDPQGERDFMYLDVQDNNNVNASTILLGGTGSYNSGNNTNWDFGERYWVGSYSGCRGVFSDSDCWSSVSGGPGGADVPGLIDIAYFDSGDTTNCTVDMVVSVSGIRVESGYTGTIQSSTGNNITVGVERFLQKDGSVLMNGANMVNNDNFYVYGGSFDMGTGSFSSKDFYYNYFTPMTASADFSDASSVIVDGHFVFGSNTGASSGTFSAPSELKISGNFYSYSGNNSLFTHNNGLVTFNGAGDSTYDYKDSNVNFYDLKLSKDSSTAKLYLTADIAVLGDLNIVQGNFEFGNASKLYLSGDFLRTSTTGVFSAGTSELYLNGSSQTIYNDNNFYKFTKSISSADTLYFESGKTTAVSNALTLSGTSSATLTLRSTSDGNQWYINPSGTKSVSYVDVKDSNNANAVPILVSNSVDSGNNIHWDFGKRYYVGANNGSWNSSNNWATTSGGKIGAGVPSSVNQVIFDSSNNCVIPDSYTASAYSVLLESSYSGTVFGGNGTANFDYLEVRAGTYDNEEAALNVDTLFKQTAGAFDGGSGTISAGGNMEILGGTFDSGTSSHATSGNLVVNALDGYSNNAVVDFSASPQLRVGGIFYLGRASSSGSFTAPANLIAYSDVVFAGSTDFVHSNGKLTFGGDSDQDFYPNGETFYDMSLYMESGASFTYMSDLLVLNTLSLDGVGAMTNNDSYDVYIGKNLNNNSETVSTTGLNSATVFYFNGSAQTINGSVTLPNLSKISTVADVFTFDSGERVTITGTMTLRGNSSSARLSLRSSSDGVRAEIDPQGTRNIAFLNVKDNQNVNSAAIEAVNTGSVDSGNNINWNFGLVLNAWVDTFSNFNFRLFAGVYTTVSHLYYKVAPYVSSWVDFGEISGAGRLRSSAVFSGALYVGGSDGNLYRKTLEGVDVNSGVSNPVLNGQYSHLTFVMKPGDDIQGDLYIDGAKVASDGGASVSTSIESNDLPLLIGNSYGSTIGGNNASGEEYFEGKIDEFRIAGTSFSDGYIETVYNNLDDPSGFVTFGAEEEYNGQGTGTGELPTMASSQEVLVRGEIGAGSIWITANGDLTDGVRLGQARVSLDAQNVKWLYDEGTDYISFGDSASPDGFRLQLYMVSEDGGNFVYSGTSIGQFNIPAENFTVFGNYNAETGEGFAPTKGVDDSSATLNIDPVNSCSEAMNLGNYVFGDELTSGDFGMSMTGAGKTYLRSDAPCITRGSLDLRAMDLLIPPSCAEGDYSSTLYILIINGNGL